MFEILQITNIRFDPFVTNALKELFGEKLVIRTQQGLTGIVANTNIKVVKPLTIIFRHKNKIHRIECYPFKEINAKRYRVELIGKALTKNELKEYLMTLV